jgi:NADPH:quinone reductase-like Zn-dependent oxidoreductase
MKAAVVTQAGAPPRYLAFEAPTPAEGEHRIAVSAAALSQLTRSRAAGAHYSSGGVFPFVAGVDGVGRTETGERVYFVLPRAPYGAMAQLTVVPAARCLPLPDDLDDVTAAALANPGMSSWAAYRERAKLRPGETVLVNGATGASGRLAVQIAKHMGAKRVVATGRNRAALAELEALGADAAIALDDEARIKAAFASGIDVVIDYLWGESAERLLMAAAKSDRDGIALRFVQVGSASGGEIKLPSAALRACAVELMGSGVGSVGLEKLVACVRDLLAVAGKAGFRIAARELPLAEVESGWREDGPDRLVFRP